MNDIRRGDIYWIINEKNTGVEMSGMHPGVIVSNDKGNAIAPYVQIVYLSTQPKKPFPMHVIIKGKDAVRSSIAQCEQIFTIDKERLGGFVGRCTPGELACIDEALILMLELGKKT